MIHDNDTWYMIHDNDTWYKLPKQDYNTIGTVIKMEMAWLTGWQVIW